MRLGLWLDCASRPRNNDESDQAEDDFKENAQPTCDAGSGHIIFHSIHKKAWGGALARRSVGFVVSELEIGFKTPLWTPNGSMPDACGLKRLMKTDLEQCADWFYDETNSA